VAEITLFRHEPTQRTLGAGEWLFSTGDPAEHMYGVIEGAIEVVVGDEVVETVGPGGVLGEMALLDEAPRSASARAAEDTVVAEISRQRFLTVVKSNPFFALDLMRILAERLRRQT
jgi:CRP-like cAMP-binding protein